MELSEALVRSLLESDDPFPVDFEDAWRWIGYSTKQKAKNKLINHFEEGEDYLTKWMKTPEGGRPSEQILLAVACFKDLGMMAGTEQGKKVRQYFRGCEEYAKKAAVVIPAQNERLRELELENENLRLKDKVIAGQERMLARAEVLAITAEPLATAILCPGVTVIEKTIVKETTVIVDYQGQPIAQYDGLPITHLAKRYGFGKGTKANDACRAWLLSIGIKPDEWVPEPMAHTTWKLPREKLKVIDKEFLARGGDRQKLIGEWG